MPECRNCRRPVPVSDALCFECVKLLVEALRAEIAHEPEDPTTRTCTVCGERYALKDARVVRALKTARPEHQKLAKLCWVCARLHGEAHREENVPQWAMPQ
jgi:CRISPR/Cas system-associated protein Cas10 (large subunit of type III CRISPR-Cas system)